MCSYKERALFSALAASPSGHPQHAGLLLQLLSPLPAHLIGDRACIVLHSEDWQRQLGLGVPRAISMMVMTLLEEGVVSGL